MRYLHIVRNVRNRGQQRRKRSHRRRKGRHRRRKRSHRRRRLATEEATAVLDSVRVTPASLGLLELAVSVVLGVVVERLAVSITSVVDRLDVFVVIGAEAGAVRALKFL